MSVLLLSGLGQAANAQTKEEQEEMEMLRLFYREERLVVSTTRHEKPVSAAAENVTIVTAAEIEEMNAHTVADVLNHITGVQMDMRGGVGNAANISIQGSHFKHVLVLIDGIRLNNLSDFFPDVAAIPVQHIARIEIIKGPASSAWGSSLGGVINIVTKPTGRTKKPDGTFYASYGEQNTGDYRAETSGMAGRFGYYLSAGRLESDGFIPNTSFENNNVYSKLRADLSGDSHLTLTFGYRDGSRGMGQSPGRDMSYHNDFEYLFSTLSLNSALTGNTDLDVSLRALWQDNDNITRQLSTGYELNRIVGEDESEGGSLKLVSRYGPHTMVLGADYDDGEAESTAIPGNRRFLRRLAVYANDTIGIDDLSITPGVRYDDINTSGDFVSPSLGATYSLNKKYLLRLAVARGFNTPSLSETFGKGLFFNPNPDLKVEEVWSYQAGVESIFPGYLWLRATAFRHDVDNAITYQPEPDGTYTAVNKDRIRRQGVEIELETVRVYNLSLEAGYIYQDAENRETGETIEDVAEYTIDIGLKYDDRKSLRAVLLGHYIWWNTAFSRGGKYDTFIWDLNIIRNVYRKNNRSAEVFLGVHNIFDGSQYLYDAFKNPGRWVEAGVRLGF